MLTLQGVFSMSVPSVSSLQSLVPLLQASISPVTVISGVGMLVFSMTNRYGRVIDRVRYLMKEHALVFKALKLHELNQSVQQGSQQPLASSGVLPEEALDVPFLLLEMKILYGRARTLRWSITLALLCLFLVALTIGLLFSGMLFGLPWAIYTCGVFMAALALLLGSIAFLFKDILLSLKALKLELNYRLPEGWFTQ
jgi:Protein of unknown function (DUF2721)